MEFVSTLFDFILNIDHYIDLFIESYGIWTYLILFLIIFFETGFVITPLLPGDSLLFAAGAFAARGSLEIGLLIILLIVAAIIGDAVNYWIGSFIGPKVFKKEKSRFFKKAYLEKTHRFYEKHGKKTIVLARFVPIVRTFAPFIAGVGRMPYKTFATYNIVGAILWVVIFALGGFYFGTIPYVEDRFSLVILGIIIISLIPVAVEVVKTRKRREI